jgi:hypothetical protein
VIERGYSGYTNADKAYEAIIASARMIAATARSDTSWYLERSADTPSGPPMAL